MYIIMFVLDNPEQLDDVLVAWQAVGVSGITIIESSGFHRRQAHLLGARFVLTLPELGQRIAQGSYTLFAAVASDQLVEQCFDATEAVVGNLQGPNTGVLIAWPLSMARGLEKRQHATEAEQ